MENNNPQTSSNNLTELPVQTKTRPTMENFTEANIETQRYLFPIYMLNTYLYRA